MWAEEHDKVEIRPRGRYPVSLPFSSSFLSSPQAHKPPSMPSSHQTTSKSHLISTTSTSYIHIHSPHSFSLQIQNPSSRPCTNPPRSKNSLMALTFFASVVFVWLPYCLKSCKNVQHHCGNEDCGALLATWHRVWVPGSIKVQAFH